MEGVVPINSNLLNEISKRKYKSKAIHGYAEVGKLAEFICWQWTVQRTKPWGYSETREAIMTCYADLKDGKLPNF